MDLSSIYPLDFFGAKFEEFPIRKTLSFGCKFYRKMTKYFKGKYGNDWVNKFEKKVKLADSRPWFHLNSLYYLSVQNSVDGVLRHNLDFIYGLYFDPSVWKKGQMVKFKIHDSRFIRKRYDFNDNNHEWSLVLNNDDGFYPYCFFEFGIFPAVLTPYTEITLILDEKDVNKEYKLFGFNVPIRTVEIENLGFDGIKISRSNIVVRGGVVRFNVKPKEERLVEDWSAPVPVIYEDHSMEWDFLDWAANRIKKALREWFEIRKRMRMFKQSVCGEIRALPNIGVDYVERLEKWPRNK